MKIKPNTLFKKWGPVSQTDLGNPGNHNFGLLGGRVKSEESRRTFLGQNHRCKFSFHAWVGHQESPPGSAQRKFCSRAELGGSQRHGQQASLHPQGDICPSKPTLPALGGAEEPSQRDGWLPWVGKSHGKDWMGPVGPLLQGSGFGLFSDALVGDQHVSGWGFCFLSNHMLSSGGSQQVSHAGFKALAPHCLASWGVEIHDFH